MKPEYAKEQLPIYQLYSTRFWAEEMEEAGVGPSQYRVWRPRQRRNRNRRLPLNCCICGIKRSFMALKISLHEEYGSHTVYYCSTCHRETFEAWYQEQEASRQGKWTGTNCLVC